MKIHQKMSWKTSFLASQDGLGLQEPKASFVQTLLLTFWRPRAAPKRPRSASGRPREAKSALPDGQKSARRPPKRHLEATFAFALAFTRTFSVFACQNCKKTHAKTAGKTGSKKKTPLLAWKRRHAYSLVKYSVPACSRKKQHNRKISKNWQKKHTKNDAKKRLQMKPFLGALF